MQQSTQGAELNSEATLNCNGKEFKCINATHYQPCSLTERSGQQPLWTINGVTLRCAAGKSCDDQSAEFCGIAARTIQPVDQPAQIPVEVTIIEEPINVEQAVIAAVESIVAPAKSLPVEQPAAIPAAAEPVVAPVVVPVDVAAPVEQQQRLVPAAPTTETIVASSTEQGNYSYRKTLND